MVQRLILDGRIQVNGSPVKPTHPVVSGDVVTLSWPNPEATQLVAQEIPLEVLYEDEDLIVINKPYDLVVHPSAGHADGTVVNALLHRCHGDLSGVGGVERPGIVHRLDLGTSGALVVAKNDRTHLALSQAFRERQVEKVYHLIACGDVLPSAGDIRAAIARHPSHRKRMAVKHGGRDAWTTYHTVERLGGQAAYCEAELHTGRTHQIRVHFQHLGYPLLGDEVYGKRQSSRVEQETGVKVARQMLHALRLSFNHPRDGRRMEFQAPLPQDFRLALEALREWTQAHS
jgi:23S rRNA pseudouridine1911/1915/1917 synthase